ncbi:hypothetical protein HMPREF9383_2282 [Streptococcus sanguinis SK150]|uniref:Uncharacterized protein n=1 Tax=Streptococcus sanguinis SK150 TaxID=888811 RepID=F0IPE0_STRSA|nr:hypothetical protein HMPREF9383_2282 [Streptococcus sanguinis SK150]
MSFDVKIYIVDESRKTSALFLWESKKFCRQKSLPKLGGLHNFELN